MFWYAVNTKPHQEQQAAQNLQALGVEVFCPRVNRRRTIRRKVQNVTRPLFPGYLFALCDLATQFRPVSYARGVRKIVAFGPTPTPVDEEIINKIRARLVNGCLIAPGVSLKPGQTVCIQNGPLKGMEAIFESEMSDCQRVVVLLRAIASRWR